MATIKFSEFDAGNISLAGTQLVGLSGGNSATNARFTAADLVNGLATITYVDSQDAGLQSQITQNTNDIAAIDTASIIANVTTLQGQVTVLQGNIVVLDGAVAALENNVSVNQDDIVVLQGNVIQIENELANIADTDNQTLSYDGATANLSISNGNNVVLQEVLDNAGNITVIQGQIADLQANGNIQLLSLDNSSNVLSISGGNTVDFTTVLGNVAGGTAGTLQEVTDAGNTTVTNITVADVTSTGNICVGTGIGGAITGAISISSESLIATSNLTVAGFLVDGIIDDDTLATASATTLATSESIKAYVDASSQTLSLNNSSNVLTISDGNTVDFTTVLGSVAGGGGLAAVVDDTSPELGGELNDGGFGIVMENGSPIESGIVFTNGSGTTFAKIETRPDSGDFVILGDDHNLVLRSFQDVELVTANDLKLKGLTWPASDGSAGQVLVTDGAGTLSFGTGGGGGNPFDQNLDTTDSPTFDNLSTTGELDVNGSGTHSFQGTIEFTQLANFGGTVGITALLDEDDMVSDSATALATQQSIKAYVDAKPLSGVAIGPGLVTEPTAGDQGIGMGDGADAALQSIAIGLDADASVAFTTAIGKNSSATGNFGIAIGEGATAGLQSVALGLNADASQNYVTAIGWDAVATGPGSTALGHECEATGAGAIAVGSDSTATSTASLAIGYKSDVQAPYGTSIGWQNDLSSAASYTVSIGNYVSNNTYTQPDAIKVCAGSTYQTQLEVRPDYLDISSDNFGIACNASVGFTFTDAINGNVTLTSLIGGGGGGGANIAVATASDGQDYLTTFDTSFFITADPTSTDTGYIAMGEAAPQTWGSGAYVLHGSGLGQSILTGKTITNKIGHNGPHLGMAAWNEIYLGTRYAALYTDSSYYATLSATSLGHVALAIDNVDKLVVDGATDKVIIETDLDVTGNIIPSANITYDLGSETNRWKDLWLSGNTIHLGDTSISADDGTLSIDGLDLENTYATTSSIVNTATEVYNSNGILPADPKGMAVADPNGAGGWYWSSPGPGASPIGLNSFQWRMFNNNGPQTYTVADIDYMYMVVDLYTVGQVYFNIYTGTGPIPTTFTSRFSFTLNGDFASTGRFLMWAKPPGSTTTVDDVEVYPFLERLELPYDALASSGPLLTSERIKSLNVQTRTSPALTAGEVEFNLKNVGYKVKGGYIQNFDMDIYNPFDQGVSTTDTPEFQGVTATTGTVRLASLTTTERDTTLTAVDGDMIYNTTDSKLQGYQAGGWINLDGS